MRNGYGKDNEFEESNQVKTIRLTQGQCAIVDDEDFQWLSQWPWYALKAKRKRLPTAWYAVRHSTWKGPIKYMHREIAQRRGSNSFQVDHHDGDGLNNQWDNLRPCSQTQNNGNRKKLPGCTSRFKGVSWFPRTKKWVVFITCNGIRKNLGYFDKEEDAAIAYDIAALVRFGEFAKVNFP